MLALTVRHFSWYLIFVLVLAGHVVAGTPKESDFPCEFTVVASGAYPNNVCWLVLQNGNELYRVRDTGYVHKACLPVGAKVRGQVKGPQKAVPQNSWLGRMGRDVRVKVLHEGDDGKPTVTTYLVESITEAQAPATDRSAPQN